MMDYYDPEDIDEQTLRLYYQMRASYERQSHYLKWIRNCVLVGFVATLILILVDGASGSEMMCVLEEGCDSVTKGPDGPVVVHHRHGTIVDTDEGWLVREDMGWVFMDLGERFCVPSLVGL